MTDSRFPLGIVVSTPAALIELEKSQTDAITYLISHATGDWGDLSENDKQLNDRAVSEGDRILSSYTLSTGVKLWIITEADRSSTCILLSDEY